jgi:hypothetical protein
MTKDERPESTRRDLMGLQTIPPECSVTQILVCAYKRSRKHLDLPIYRSKSAEDRLSALAMRLRRTAYFDGARYHADLIGGKGGTRTLDPGIVSVEPKDRALAAWW